MSDQHEPGISGIGQMKREPSRRTQPFDLLNYASQCGER